MSESVSEIFVNALTDSMRDVLFYSYESFQTYDFSGFVCSTASKHEENNQTQNNRREEKMWKFKKGDAVLLNLDSVDLSRYSVFICGEENGTTFSNRIYAGTFERLSKQVLYIGARVGAGYQLVTSKPEPGEKVSSNTSRRVPASVLIKATPKAIEEHEYIERKKEFWNEVGDYGRKAINQRDRHRRGIRPL